MNSRIERLKESLNRAKLDSLLVTNFYNIRYLSGFMGLTPQEREAYLLVTNEEVFLFTDGRYITVAQKLKTQSAIRQPAERTKLKTIEIKQKDKIAKLMSGLATELRIRRLGIEKNDLRVSEYEEIKKYLKMTVPLCQIIYTENLVEGLRAQKEPDEFKRIEKAAKIADKCFEHLLGFLKPGITEKEVANEIEWFVRNKGASDISFDPIVAGGPNSSLPHHITGKREFRTNDIVLLDFGAKVDGYCSDITRVVFLGKATLEQKKIYQAVLSAQNKALDALLALQKRVKARDIDKIARDYLKSLSFKLVHGLGHGIGLSEHEAPRLGPTSRDILKEDMVFSLEPGVYLPGRFGVRIEDLVFFEKSSPRILTESTKDIIEL